MDFVTIDFDRTVEIPLDATRRTVLAALDGMGFSIDRAEGAVVEAHRGSKARSAFGGPRPVRLSTTVMGHNGSARVHVHVGDGEPVPLKPQAAQRIYAPLFLEVQQGIDASLRAIDPSVATDEVPELEFHVDQRAGVRGQLGQIIKGLPGPLRDTATRAVHDEVALWLRAPDASAVLIPSETEMYLAIASIISADPTALPAPLHRRLEDLTVRLAHALETATPPRATLELTAADVPAADFLYQQSLIRQGLPLREVHACRDCGFSRIVNPDYQHQLAKNQRLQHALGLVGMTMSPAGLNPFLVFGRLSNLGGFAKRQEACRRCEGVDMDITLATMCPECRTILTATVLRTCPHEGCSHDFLAAVVGDSLWSGAMQERTERALAPAADIGTATTGATADPGWYPDPMFRHQVRWFDQYWTTWVSDNGITSEDPLT